MDDSEIKKLYKELGIPLKKPNECHRDYTYDFFPKTGHKAWRRLKV